MLILKQDEWCDTMARIAGVAASIDGIDANIECLISNKAFCFYLSGPCPNGTAIAPAFEVSFDESHKTPAARLIHEIIGPRLRKAWSERNQGKPVPKFCQFCGNTLEGDSC